MKLSIVFYVTSHLEKLLKEMLDQTFCSFFCWVVCSILTDL